jgi:hypothetical protein
VPDFIGCRFAAWYKARHVIGRYRHAHQSMATATRTLNPLPFADLEPKRFEDLVRQLAYEFRAWRRLEATGRSGSDDGFDARGYEIAPDVQTPEERDEDEQSGSDRLWLIQCKREKRIGPSQMKKYLGEIALDDRETLFGIVFAAACDFSKATRDELAAWCRMNGVSEWHIWGRSELEDLLFQPKLDHLLFGYFGISLQIRRRNRAVDLRHQIAIKRKLKRFLDAANDGLVLIRDIDAAYPPDEGSPKRLRVRRVEELTPSGLLVHVSQRQAWLSEDGEHWDVAAASSGINIAMNSDPWHQESEQVQRIDRAASETWQSFVESERGWFYLKGYLPYENIVLIDDIGDSAFEGPHLLVTGWDGGYPFIQAYIETVWGERRRKEVPSSETEGRVVKFPEVTRHRPPGSLATY